MTPVMLALALFIGIVALPTYWDAAHGGGSIGQLTFTNEDCSSDRTWYGNFISDDHRYDYSGVQMDDPVQDAAVGWTVRVRYEDSLGDAFALQGSRAFKQGVGAFADGTDAVVCLVELLPRKAQPDDAVQGCGRIDETDARSTRPRDIRSPDRPDAPSRPLPR